jgi:hypothetical protein
MPDETTLPPGPARDLTRAVHRLYDNAGRPSLRVIDKAIAARDDLPSTVSYELVRKILIGRRAVWAQVASLAAVLESMNGTGRPGPPRAELHALWLAADTVPAGVIANPELDALIGTVYQRPADAAIARLLDRPLVVPTSEHHEFLVAATETLGSWLFVFTATDRFAAHRAATGRTGPRHWSTVLGRDLLREVGALDLPLGVVVDPNHVTGVAATLALTAAMVAEVCATL